LPGGARENFIDPRAAPVLQSALTKTVAARAKPRGRFFFWREGLEVTEDHV
jgi:hypothetical protein